MRQLTFPVVLAALCLFAVPARAQSIGETVVVIRPTDVKVRSEIVYRHNPGIHLVVGAVQGNWLWINHKVSGWISRDDVLPLDESAEFFSKRLEQDPGNLDLHLALANVRSAQGQWEQAIESFNQVLKLDPNNVAAYGNRAIAWRNMGDYPKAIADYDAAIRLAPDHALLHRNRGIAWRHQKEYDRALADFNEAIRLEPNQAGGYNSRAWLRATCSDPQIANAADAVADATRACELSSWKSAEYLETLATAYAAKGEFSEAVKWQSRAQELAPESQKVEATRLLRLYSDGQPYREPAASEVAATN